MKSSLKTNKIIDYICIFLILLIFISKISLKSFKIIPFSLSYVIYQHGLHPYINIAAQFACFIILIFYWGHRKSQFVLDFRYRLFIYFLIALITIQTICQILMSVNSIPVSSQISGMLMAIMIMLVYGVIIPSIFSVNRFVNLVKKISTFFVFISFISLPLFYSTMFRGGRFIGYFKHIPHMVTASTTALIFYFPTLFSHKKWTLKNNSLISIFIAFVLIASVIITSTKAAFITMLMTIFIGIFIFGRKSRNIRLFKFTFLSSALVLFLFMGAPIIDLGIKVSTGQLSFGMRPAQDGIQTRLEEIERGMSIFEKSPYFGMGLMYKYSQSEEDAFSVDKYNSFKDPHNLFVSAGVVGGYPLMLVSIFAYMWMIWISLKHLGNRNPNVQICALFLFAHIPVFLIYHAHFSLGGMGDRIYWLIFGYLAQSKNSITLDEY